MYSPYCWVIIHVLTKSNLGRFVIKTWHSFIYQNVIYDLQHLNQFEWLYIQPAKNNKTEIQYPFIIEFGLHCFTRGLNTHKSEQWESIDKTLIYTDSREKRIFDINRYQLSKNLPEIIQNIGAKNCFHTGKENFFITELINEDNEKQEYEVYFQILKLHKKLKLFIQSAYVRDSMHLNSQPKKKKISFFVIAYNIKTNKQIKML